MADGISWAFPGCGAYDTSHGLYAPVAPLGHANVTDGLVGQQPRLRISKAPDCCGV